MALAFIFVAVALVEAWLVSRFGALPYVVTTLIVTALLFKLRRAQPPVPERVRALGAIGLGASIGFLAIWVGGPLS